MNSKQDLEIFFKHSERAPFLFLGSGFTRHYFNTPDWEKLLEQFSPCHINQYKSKGITSFPSIASAIAKDLNEQFWNLPDEDDFKSRNQQYVNTPSAVLKIKIANYFKEQINNIISSEFQDEIDVLRKSSIDGIITTNWDNFAETLFPDFKTYVGQQEFLSSFTYNIGEIFKIHGCISNPSSIVLTEEDYEDFNRRNACLAAKLLTIFIEHPIIFIGYSVSDSNIQELLTSINDCIDSNISTAFQKRIFFVEWTERNNDQFDIFPGSISLKDGKTFPITRIITHTYMPLFECLSSFERKIPTSELRKYQDLFYQIVQSQKPEKQIYVLQGKPDSINKDPQFVFGFGAIKMAQLSERGYTGITDIDIYKDVLQDTSSYDARKILLESMPKLKTTTLPKYKYLSLLNVRSEEQLLASEYSGINIQRIADLQRYSRKNICQTVSDILNDTSIELDKKAAIIPKITLQDGDLELIKNFLVENIDSALLGTQLNSTQKTYFRKLVCFDDLIKYGWQ
jgi:hypothetical protein